MLTLLFFNYAIFIFPIFYSDFNVGGDSSRLVLAPSSLSIILIGHSEDFSPLQDRPVDFLIVKTLSLVLSRNMHHSSFSFATKKFV